MQGNNLSGAQAPFTCIHRLDPRTKLPLLAASFVMVQLPKSPLVVALVTLTVMGHVTLAQGPGGPSSPSGGCCLPRPSSAWEFGQ
jgi:hypothetical protein